MPKPTEEELYNDYKIKKLSAYKLEKKYNICRTSIYKLLNQYNIPRNMQYEYFGNILNKTFGKLKVIYIENKDNRLWCTCLCECGNQTTVQKGWLTSGNTKTCGCSHRRRGENHPTWSGYKDISGSYWQTVKYAAKSRNLILDLDIKKLWKLYLNQNKKCVYSDLNINFNTLKSGDGNNQTASLDRINSNIGYIESNVQWVHKDVNIMKNSLSEQNFLYWVNLIINSVKTKKRKIIINTNRPNNYKGYMNLSGVFWDRILRGARSRNINVNISIQDAWNIYINQNGKCIFTGLEIDFANNLIKESSQQTASLDRINPKKDYDINNIQWTHKTINKMKWDLNNEYFIDLCKIINEYQTL